ncbi:N-acetylneuraminate epimerase precursor [Rubripirellula lacrimiformis]|uniref:N-acetylneuraminate epimerase n=1 Tax=Rubripirellula lacrimiformis TaxID=1930273 RepID=A0A517NEF0_9BACT|nr:kelch repeat-containing protein [Rubripirellula lacrimiformis]QDT05492.1 N-acetylneuraminate epimerase precursor [Rubripirellula lacrimiformis]
MTSYLPRRSFAIAFFCLAGSVATPSLSWAHFPWLASNDDGRAVMWFGESTADRVYPMPAKVQAIELNSDGAKHPVATKSVDGDDLVGIQSTMPINSHAELSGSVTYGLYHGTKLTYHVEHLPQTDPTQWPSEPRSDAPMQTVVIADGKGGVEVKVLADGEPLADTEVKLYCEEGHQEAARNTDAAGLVSFTASEVESGLNAIVVGVTKSDVKGELDGEPYSSTTDYLTATFSIGKSDKNDSASKGSAAAPAKPKVDSNSGVSVGPTGLAELPEELTSFGAAIAGNRLFVYGGHTGDAHSYSTEEQSNRLWSLDLSQGDSAKWQELASGPRLQGLALVAHGDRVVRIGGFSAVNDLGDDHELHSQTSVASYDPATNQWSDLASLPEPRSSLDAAVIGDKVYVFGGWKLDGDSDTSEWLQTAYCLDLSNPSAKWQATAQPPFKRRATSVAAFDGKLYVIGGMRPEGGPTTRVDIYDPKSDSWSDGPSIPGAGMSGFGSSSFASGGNLYCSTMDGFVHRLDPSGKGWTTVAKCQRARFFHRMLPRQENELLMVGGANMQIGKFTVIDAVTLTSKE